MPKKTKRDDAAPVAPSPSVFVTLVSVASEFLRWPTQPPLPRPSRNFLKLRLYHWQCACQMFMARTGHCKCGYLDIPEMRFAQVLTKLVSHP